MGASLAHIWTAMIGIVVTVLCVAKCGCASVLVLKGVEAILAGCNINQSISGFPGRGLISYDYYFE